MTCHCNQVGHLASATTYSVAVCVEFPHRSFIHFLHTRHSLHPHGSTRCYLSPAVLRRCSWMFLVCRHTPATCSGCSRKVLDYFVELFTLWQVFVKEIDECLQRNRLFVKIKQRYLATVSPRLHLNQTRASPAHASPATQITISLPYTV